MEEDFYCGDIVEPGSHISLDDVIHYFNIFNGDVRESSLSPTQRKLLNILNSEQYAGVDKTNLDELYNVLSGIAASVLCVDRPVECCLGKNEIQTYGTTEEYPAIKGVSVQVFEENGLVCFNDLELDGLSYPYGVTVNKKDGSFVYGKIKATGKFTNNEIVYYSPAGDFYTGRLTTTSGFDNQLDYAGECILDGEPIPNPTPTPTYVPKPPCEDHACNLTLTPHDEYVNFQRSFSILGNAGTGERELDGSSQVKYLVPEKLQVNTISSPGYASNWVCVLFDKRYTLQNRFEFLCTTLEFTATSDRDTSVGFLVKQNDSYYRYQMAIGTNFDLNINELQLSQDSFKKIYGGGPEQLDFYKNADFEFGLDFSSTGSSTFSVITKLSICLGGDFLESEEAPTGPVQPTPTPTPTYIDDSGSLYLASGEETEVHIPSIEFFGCAGTPWASVKRTGAKPRFAAKYGHGQNGDENGGFNSYSLQQKAFEFRGNTIVIGAPQSRNTAGNVYVWNKNKSLQSDVITETVWKTSGGANPNQSCDPINQQFRGDIVNSGSNLGDFVALNINGTTAFCGVPNLPQGNQTSQVAGGYMDVPINSSNGLATLNQSTTKCHRMINYANGAMNISGIAVDGSNNTAFARPAYSNGIGAVQIGTSYVFSPTSSNGRFGLSKAGSRVLASGNNFFVVSNYSIGVVYIITKQGNVWAIRSTISADNLPPEFSDLNDFGFNVSATPPNKTSQYIAVQGKKTNDHVVTAIFGISIMGIATYANVIDHGYTTMMGLCVNQRENSMLGNMVDVYVGNATSTIDHYNGLTGTKVSNTIAPEHGKIIVAGEKTTSVSNLGACISTNGTQVAVSCSAFAYQPDAQGNKVNAGNNSFIIFDVQNS